MRDPRSALGAAAVALLLAFARGGEPGAAGMAAGLAATALHFILLWHAIGLAGRFLSDRNADGHRRAGPILAAGMLLSLPALVLAGRAVQDLPDPAFPNFLLGMGLVYFGLVGWAMARD